MEDRLMEFSWTTAAFGLLNLLVGGALVKWIGSRPAILKIESDREANLLHERAEEMASMREELAAIRTEMAHAAQAHAEELDRRARIHDAERRADIHRINNLSQCFDALMLLLKQGVAVEDAIEAVEKMRQEQLTRENEERALIRAATITATQPVAEAKR